MSETEKIIAYVKKQVYGIPTEPILRAIKIATNLPTTNLGYLIPDHYVAVCMRAESIWLAEKKGW